ncbi:MAG: glycosyltransferase [Candidatus Marsarchaeota archaeon]|nr:glycosyltransferase [Candidatus Marsarchaeota archaeon]MCL5961446.1 glycosyltransferase [Chloroflexota bacterium]
MPKVSVIIPTYNRSGYLSEALNSVLNQTFRDFEIIVVDDGSTDDTKAVAEKAGERVRYVWQVNQGLSSARNTGIREALGDYVVFLDSDDLILPRKLECQATYLDEHSAVGVVYSDVYFCDEAGRNLALFSEYAPGRQCSGDVLGELIKGSLMPVHAAMVRKLCLNEVGGFDETLPSLEDWDLWIRIAQAHHFAYLSQPVAKYRLHGSMMSHDVRRMSAATVAVSRKIEAYPFFQDLPPDSRHGFYWAYGRAHCLAGNMRPGRRLLRQALELNPRSLRPYAYLALSMLGQRAFRTVAFFQRGRRNSGITIGN